MTTNPKYEKILTIMKAYDSSPSNSEERKIQGLKLDKEGSKITESEYWKIVKIYENIV